MKWITPLWSDPIGWSDWVAKTKLRVIIWTLIHIAFVVWGIIMIQKYGIVQCSPNCIHWSCVSMHVPVRDASTPENCQTK